MDTFFSKLKDPKFFRENRTEPHSDHIAYAPQDHGKNSSFRESLNGYWKFCYADNFDQVPDGFEAESYDTGDWDLIRVPEHIQLQGYDRPQYVNVQYPWDGHEELKPGEIPMLHNPVANYVKHFMLPERFTGQRVFLSFQGVESSFRVWLNGTYIGFSSDSFTPSEFELTDYLKEGKNKLAVQVYKWYSGSWLEDQDFFRFSGIFRDVYLYAAAKHHIQDIRIDTELDPDDFRHGKLRAFLTLLSGGADIQAELLDPDGIRIEKQDIMISDDTRTVDMTFPIRKPRLWSAEHPALYLLRLTVSDPENGEEEWTEQKIGFRHFALDSDHLMKINGKRIVFRGVNRHEFSADHGRTVSEEELRKDLYTMKQNNINAIRLCHYPNSSRIYELADELGFYLIDECNMESHGSWEPVEKGMKSMDYAVPGDHREYEPMLLDRINSMVQRDKNHPSILIWSCGNESFGGPVIYQMSRQLKKMDPSRLVHYEGIFHDRRFNDTSDMESQMYTPAVKIKEFLKEHREKPFICCEYMHAMGNSCGALFKYTDLTEEDPLYQGGFIWDYIDQGIRRKDSCGNEYFAYGGDFDDRPNDGNFSGDGLVDCNRNPTPKMAEVKFCYQSIAVSVFKDSFLVKNKYLFTNTDQFACVAQLYREGKLIEEENILAAAAPLTERMISLPFSVPEDSSEYAVTVSFRLKEDVPWAKAGYEIAFGQQVFTDSVKSFRPANSSASLRITAGDFNIGIQGDGFEILFSRMYGGLYSYKYKGQEMLSQMVKPNFWRAPTDNDRGCGLPFRCGVWKLASLYSTSKPFEYPKIEQKPGSVLITYVYDLPLTPAQDCTVTYEVYGNGLVETELRMLPSTGRILPELPMFSLFFPLKQELQTIRWYGYGLSDSYADRCLGVRLGIYQTTVAENVTSYLKPQESGNHMGVRWMKITNAKGKGILFYGNRQEISVSPWTSHELEAAMHPVELPPSHRTCVCIGRQMGVGGDDSWGAQTHPEYRLDSSKPQAIKFAFQGIG